MSDMDYLPSALPVELDKNAQEGLSIYLDQLLAWNKVLNLSAFTSREKIIRELIIDSFYLADFLGGLFPGEASPYGVDLGSGAGLPGIPLRLLWKAGDYAMVEAREKRALFLTNVLSRLKLDGTSVFRGRAEKFFSSLKPERQIDYIVSRAFMPWPKLGSFCWPHLPDSAFLIIMANEKAPADLGDWRLFQDYSYPVDERIRYFWALQKNAG